jgi:hypothetical protein
VKASVTGGFCWYPISWGFRNPMCGIGARAFRRNMARSLSGNMAGSFGCLGKVGARGEDTLGCVGWFGFAVDNPRHFEV